MKTQKGLFDCRIGRRDLIKLAGSAAATGLLSKGLPRQLMAQTGKPSERPNIIYILGDNHNADTAGFAGHPFIKTPGMDRLAKEGMVFERTYTYR